MKKFSFDFECYLDFLKWKTNFDESVVNLFYSFCLIDLNCLHARILELEITYFWGNQMIRRRKTKKKEHYRMRSSSNIALLEKKGLI